MIKLCTRVFIALLLVSIFNVSCKDDDEELGPATSLNINFEFIANGEEVSLADSYRINGTEVTFEVISYYVGGLSFNTNDGDILSLGNDYLLATENVTGTINGDFEISKINSASFFVGVDPVSNSQTELDFTERGPSDPLSVQDPSMHWNWNSGYKFIRLDGNADLDNDGVFKTPIVYHLGSDALLTNIDTNTDLNIDEENNTVVFSLDLNQFFKDVDFAVESNWDTHTGNNLELAQQLQSNLSTAISLK